MKIFSRFPVFRMVIPFSAGILITIHKDISIGWAISGAIIGLILSILFTTRNYATGKYAQRWLAGIPFYTCFLCLGMCLTWYHQSLNFRRHFSDFRLAETFVSNIQTEPKNTAKGYRFIVAVKAVRQGSAWTPVSGNLAVFLSDTSHKFKGTQGAIFIFTGKPEAIAAPTNPEAFDARYFYASKGAWHHVFAEQGNFILLESLKRKSIFFYATMLRDNMLEKLQRHLEGDDLGVAGALLLGYEDWLDPELENSWSGAGVLHVLCVSGMHVMLIYVILAGMLSWMEKIRWLRHLRYMLLLSLIWFYAMVTGFSPSVIRAAAMISFVIFGNWINREASIYNLLCSSCILMFVLDPYLISSAGFQLSFLAVCGIIFLNKLIFPFWIAPNRPLHLLWELISVSLAAQIATFPLSLYLFHQFPNYFLVANILIIPLSTGVMYSGLILLVTDWIPFVGVFIGSLTSFGIRALNWLVVSIGKIPGALTENVFLSGWQTLVLYMLIIFVPCWLVLKNRMWLFACLGTLVAFLAMRINDCFQSQNQTELVVFDCRKQSLLAIVNGNTATVISDSALQEKAMQYASKEYFIRHQVQTTRKFYIENSPVFSIESQKKGTAFFVKDWTKGKHPLIPLKKPKVDVLILGGYLGVEAKEILKYFTPKWVVFDSSCKSYKAKALSVELNRAGIKTHLVLEKGAFRY